MKDVWLDSWVVLCGGWKCRHADIGAGVGLLGKYKLL